MPPWTLNKPGNSSHGLSSQKKGISYSSFTIGKLSGFVILTYEQKTQGIPTICFLHSAGRVFCLAKPAQDQCRKMGEIKRSHRTCPPLGILPCTFFAFIEPLA